MSSSFALWKDWIFAVAYISMVVKRARVAFFIRISLVTPALPQTIKLLPNTEAMGGGGGALYNPKFKGSRLGWTPSSVNKMTGPGGKKVWTMTPHFIWSRTQQHVVKPGFSDGSCWEIIIIKQIHTFTSSILLERFSKPNIRFGSGRTGSKIVSKFRLTHNRKLRSANRNTIDHTIACPALLLWCLAVENRGPCVPKKCSLSNCAIY